ncbi:MAG: DNA alkylation repair protein [Bacteroidota bacterium]
MNAEEIVEILRSLGSDQTKRILLKHGAKEPVFGVKVEALKKVLKKEKGSSELAADLFRTGVYDAMYLAGLMADGSKMPAGIIRQWAETAYGGAISEYTVPWVASESSEGYLLASEWIESPDEQIAATGWATFSAIVSVWPDTTLDLNHIRLLLGRIAEEMELSPARVRYAMNGFIICAGSYIASLKDYALEIAVKTASAGGDSKTAGCRMPSAAGYINKVGAMGRTGKKRRTAKC